MFGFRPDGRRVNQEDAILEFVPFVMPQRVDAQVASVQRIDGDILTRYIRDQRAKGHVLSYMDLIIAAYVRVVSQHPDLNRFISNKRLYARNEVTVSMALLKNFEDAEKIQESTVKLHFTLQDTVYDVHDNIQRVIEENRKPEVANNVDKFIRVLLNIPGLPLTIISLARLLDRYGILPRAIVELSPFHTSLFFVNMASLGMPYVNHHIYNFGTTSIFLSMGKMERTPVPGPNGTIAYRRIIPMGVMSDERITSGAEYGRAFGYWRDLLANPSLLETPPETIREDFPPEKMPGYRRVQRVKRREAKRALNG
ncbi:2-oxo acid dehydrogenase subunit E2 [Eubacteriales bacterium OttesenSCG-928-A19]|nr:2-oxo acid dehydrogenase subunit E2 [Eubacteriales bacterium OttesenSCG-928-A19]